LDDVRDWPELIEFLTQNKQVEQTYFSGGSKITANFSQYAFPTGNSALADHSLLVELADKPPFTWQPTRLAYLSINRNVTAYDSDLFVVANIVHW
jgi:hypothetical protein